jgi:hypothetical protein
MATYAHTDLGRPTPAHALTEGAEAARQALLDFARDNPVTIVGGRPKRVPRVDDVAADLVTRHVPPWELVEGDPPGAAGTFARAARAAGCEVLVIAAGPAVEVRVDRGRIRAWWTNGRTTGVVMGGRKVTVAEAKAAL